MKEGERVKIELDLIDPNPGQPRKHFAGIAQLAESIKEKGLLEPITVRPVGARYQVVIGERRYRAAKEAGLKEIDVQVKNLTDHEAFAVALVENVQRESLTPIEEAESFKTLNDQGMTQSEIAATIGKGQSYVAHKLRLLKLPPFLTFYLERGMISENHVRQVIRLKEIYPPGLVSHMNPELSADSIKGKTEAIVLLFRLRPEQLGQLIEATPPLIEVARIFADYVSKHKARIPQWQVAAFWWLSVSAELDLSVADLATCINAWRDRYYYDLSHWNNYHRETGETLPRAPKHEEDKEAARTFWDLWENLKQSASLSVHMSDDDPPELINWWLKLVCMLNGSITTNTEE